MDTTAAQPVSSSQPATISDTSQLDQQQSDQQPQSEPIHDSYADAYVPPTDRQANIDPMVDQPLPKPEPEPTDSVAEAPIVEPTENPAEPPAGTPVTEVATEPATTTSPQSSSSDEPAPPSEELADQNIFEMLGVTTGTPEQREQFLDELQQVIWEDFIEHDTKLLLTDSEQEELQTILQAAPDKNLEQQEQVVVFLEKLIPDLDDILLEKALQLKEEMARERLKALRELHRNDSDKLATIERAEQLMNQQQWRTASETLNSIG